MLAARPAQSIWKISLNVRLRINEGEAAQVVRPKSIPRKMGHSGENGKTKLQRGERLQPPAPKLLAAGETTRAPEPVTS
jgi:hypothetical protein